MDRNAQIQSTRRNRPRRGFTLVELLVVITIIGVLMSMLIPVVGKVREYAHRVACINNQSQIGLAMTLYATSKGTMPPEMSYFTDTSGTYTLGWAESLMSQLGHNDLVASAAMTEAMLRNAKPNISTLICPSDPTKVGATNAFESYVVNGGCNNAPGNNPVDWNANGAWNYHVGTNAVTPSTIAQNTTISLEFIARHDGTSNTISHSENLDAPSWICALNGPEYTQTILWGSDQGYTATSAGPINLNVGNTYGYTLARPSSNHPGGAVVGFCDGSVKFIQQSMEYQIYSTLMTSYGAQASQPGAAWAAGNAYSSATWQVAPLDSSLIPTN